MAELPYDTVTQERAYLFVGKGKIWNMVKVQKGGHVSKYLNICITAPVSSTGWQHMPECQSLPFSRLAGSLHTSPLRGHLVVLPHWPRRVFCSPGRWVAW